MVISGRRAPGISWRRPGSGRGTPSPMVLAKSWTHSWLRCIVRAWGWPPRLVSLTPRWSPPSHLSSLRHAVLDHARSTMSTNKSVGFMAVAAMLVVIAGILIKPSASPKEPGLAPLTGTGTITIDLINDTGVGGELSWASFDDYDGTVTVVGHVDPDDTVSVTLPTTGSSRWVFEIDDPSEPLFFQSYANESFLSQLNSGFRLAQDNMSMGILSSSERPATPTFSDTADVTDTPPPSIP